MGDTLQRNKTESLIDEDPKLLFTFLSYALIIVIYLNLNTLQWPFIGVAASIPYFLINASFLGGAFFEKETAFFRWVLGVLLLIMLLGFLGWLAIIIYNLDISNFSLVLFVAATASSLLNKKLRSKHAAG